MYSSLGGVGLDDPAWLEPAVAAGIFLFSLVLALAFHRLVFPLVLRLTRWTPTDLDSRMMVVLRRPVTLGIVVLGGYLALTVPLDPGVGQQNAIDTIGAVLGIVLGVIAVASLVSNVLDWYSGNIAPSSRAAVQSRLLPLFRRIAMVIIYGLGALLILDQLNINISPLIAGLGLGGLAVALAIQPTLANLFAGTYVMTEGVISTGDFIELENGISGYVTDVGWRSTRIRTWGNNLVVIPNSRFAETIITNYQEPMPAVNIYLTCGVSYDSDLYQVERVSREVMDDVLNTNPDAAKEYGSWFAFDGFGDSNVDFWLFIQAKDRLASFGVQSDLIKRLHLRFNQEGIVINYPVRTLRFPEGWGPERVVNRREPEGFDPGPAVQTAPGDGSDAGSGGDGPGP